MSILKKIFKGICNLAYKNTGLCVCVLAYGSAIIIANIVNHVSTDVSVIVVGLVAIAIAIFGTRFLAHCAEAFELMEEDSSLTAREAWKETKMDWHRIVRW